VHSIAKQPSSRHDLAVEGCVGKQLVQHTSDPKVYESRAATSLCELLNVAVVLRCQTEFGDWICRPGEFAQVRTVAL
jgi:hypothetical protein